jgi:hypothetical protein
MLISDEFTKLSHLLIFITLTTPPGAAAAAAFWFLNSTMDG